MITLKLTLESDTVASSLKYTNLKANSHWSKSTNNTVLQQWSATRMPMSSVRVHVPVRAMSVSVSMCRRPCPCPSPCLCPCPCPCQFPCHVHVHVHVHAHVHVLYMQCSRLCSWNMKMNLSLYKTWRRKIVTSVDKDVSMTMNMLTSFSLKKRRVLLRKKSLHCFGMKDL